VCVKGVKEGCVCVKVKGMKSALNAAAGKASAATSAVSQKAAQNSFLSTAASKASAATAAVTQRAAQSAASAVAAVNSSGALSFADLPVRSHCLLLSAPPTFQCPSRQVLCCTCVRA
jgi:hypothetical protein